MFRFSRSSHFTLPLWLFLLGAILFLVACQGEPGLMGGPGPKGDTGAQGIQGVKGDTGSQGLVGLKGDTGPQGVLGIPGAAGAKGDTGPAGVAAFIAADGITATITSVAIGADRKPVVSFKLGDGKGQPLKLTDLDPNPGFVIASIKTDKTTGLTQYVNYITITATGTPYVLNGKTLQPALPVVTTRPSRDIGGTFADLGGGKFTYTFANALPADYDVNATHSVGFYTSRGNRAFAANDVYTFVPAGTPVKTTRQLVLRDNCNSCHDSLKAHGGGVRQDTRLCVLCHTSQNIDPASGNNLEFNVMIHKIHESEHLPSVLAGKSYNVGTSDFSDIGWPQDIRNCTTCHKNAPNGDNYKNAPNAAACTSCHDDVDPLKGVKHDVQTNADCPTCHKADTGREFDNSVVGAHVIPVNSKQLKGFKMTLLSATVKPGQKAVVDFQLTDNTGAPLDPNKVNNLGIVIGWPTTDYAARFAETVNSISTAGVVTKGPGALTDTGAGKWRYTFSVAVSDTWNKGSVGVGMYGYNLTSITGRNGAAVAVREENVNPVIYASLDANPVVVRRTVVERARCNNCHLDLGSPAASNKQVPGTVFNGAFHGGTRRNPELCIICHNTTFADDNTTTRPAATRPPESLHFDYFIHTLHMGADRPVAASIAGVTSTEIRFPGQQNNCTDCHKAGTYLLPLPASAAATTITIQAGPQAGTVSRVIPAITAACTSCHAGIPTVAHSETMTGSKNGEACVTCHGENKDFAVSKVHQ